MQRGSARHGLRRLALAALLVSVACGPTVEPSEPRADSQRNALWRIVHDCVNGGELSCACPELRLSCCGETQARAGGAIWALSEDFVAIRNMMACGCEPELVWGLAMPRSPVRGIEDPERPSGIWPFAWAVATERIDDSDAIALVLNPRTRRSQDQMHVHILRLSDFGRQTLANLHDSPAAARRVPLARLEDAFRLAESTVGESALPRTGMLVVRDRAGHGWTLLLLDDQSPKVFTITSCDRPSRHSVAGGDETSGDAM